MFTTANISMFELRKAALDAAVMHHDETATEEAVIASAVKFESYLRKGVTVLTAAEVNDDDGDAEKCTCIACILSKAIDEAMRRAEPDEAQGGETAAQVEPEQPAETPAS